MAIVSLIALLAALAVAALLSLNPGEEDSTIPQVSVAPQLGIGLGDAVTVSPGRQLAIAPAHPAGIEGPRLAASVVTGAVGGSGQKTGLASAQVVTVAVASPPAQSPQLPPPAPIPAPAPAATPIATPVSAPAPAPAPVAAPTRPLPGTGQPARPSPSGGPGPAGGIVSGPVQIYEGDEYAYSFSFYVEPDAYRAPGEDNLILRFADEMDESHSLGLQLWDDGSGTQRGLWASGDAMEGERFLAPVAEAAWHEVVLYFQASSDDDGLYLLLLDGEPLDTRAWVSLIDSAGGYGLLEAGLFREGERVEDPSEVFFGPARLGETLEPVIP
ncbi:MAG: heparin lyase I family protein [Solirubrobacterales bacterium]